MPEEHNELSQYVLSMLDDGQGREAIELSLMEKGHDEKFVKTLVAATQTLRYAKRRAQGLTLILIGAVICFASFLITITSSFSHTTFPYVLYGLTSVGILAVFTGFTRVF